MSTSEQTTTPLKLPIDVVPGSRTLSFRWKHTTHTPWGVSVQDCEGPLPPSCEQAVADLVALAKQQASDNANLRKDLAMCEGSINMTVDRLGGTVEGAPTHGGNFLQRIDELVEIEAALDQLPVRDEVPMPTSTDKPKKGLR